ncbi:GNAT family N-acetyltransferase [Phormidium sp. LEGE 05292]|uniref:GNAT family N-acetyltransferase n=1 Tax=[Phormidium] sp. LEGE 05292 TaxID=767427 RepID=UPI001882A444|nr:GNAT family N-acetyltransferase [Phormidium sp. LEGE 05292]MBE9225394.1 GNAT family N-acetyltransferase [Phormidium sp. LEGE 05292]
MLIRPAKQSDIPAVLPMVGKICALHETWDAAKYGFLPNPAQRYDGWLGKLVNSDRTVFLVAEDQTKEQIAGFLVATIEREIPIYRLKEYAFIHDLWVESEYRRSGVARQLVMQTIEQFQKMGVEQIRLDTAAKNDAARKLFSECGFRPSVVEMLIELE